MARPKRARADRRHPLDSDRTRTHLLTGHDWQWLPGREPTEENLREAWDALRDDLMAEHVRKSPGSRPWAWWQYESKGPRLPLDGAPDLKFGDGLPLWFGTPSRFTAVIDNIDQIYESQTEFLRRHNLLSATEAKAAAIAQLEKIET